MRNSTQMHLHPLKIPRQFGGNCSKNGLNCVMSQASCFTFKSCAALRINMKHSPVHNRRRVEPTSIFYQSSCFPPNANSLHLFTLILKVTDLICPCKNILSRMLCAVLQSKATSLAQLVQGYRKRWTGFETAIT